jgi:hypothetical protein
VVEEERFKTKSMTGATVHRPCQPPPPQGTKTGTKAENNLDTQSAVSLQSHMLLNSQMLMQDYLKARKTTASVAQATTTALTMMYVLAAQDMLAAQECCFTINKPSSKT